MVISYVPCSYEKTLIASANAKRAGIYIMNNNTVEYLSLFYEGESVPFWTVPNMSFWAMVCINENAIYGVWENKGKQRVAMDYAIVKEATEV